MSVCQLTSEILSSKDKAANSPGRLDAHLRETHVFASRKVLVRTLNSECRET